MSHAYRKHVACDKVVRQSKSASQDGTNFWSGDEDLNCDHSVFSCDAFYNTLEGSSPFFGSVDKILKCNLI